MDPKLLASAPFLLAAMTVSAQDAPEPETNPAIIETDEIESPAAAQNRMMQPSWTIRSRSGATLEADIEDGGGYSSWFSGLEVDLLYPIDERTALTFGIGSSITDYDFDGNSALSLGSMSDPWNTINSNSASIGIRHGIDQRSSVFGTLNIASDGESGADFGDTITGGGIGGYTYTYSEDLTLGVAVIVQTRLEDDVLVLPFPVINWRPPIDEERRWSVGTGGSGGGPSNVAGVLVGYDASETLSFNAGFGIAGIAGDFRLDDEGLAPDGVGRDTSFPVIAGVDWKPTRNLRVAGYAGATFFHEVRLENSSGDTLAKRDVDPSPVFGFSISYRF